MEALHIVCQSDDHTNYHVQTDIYSHTDEMIDYMIAVLQEVILK